MDRQDVERRDAERGYSGEPTNLREAFQRAKADLAKPSDDVRLRWVFWHARAVAKLEVARAALKRVEAWDFECRVRALSMERIPSVAAAYDEARPKVQLDAADAMLVEAASLVEATRQVLTMLGARR
jgi:hypothetical protein